MSDVARAGNFYEKVQMIRGNPIVAKVKVDLEDLSKTQVMVRKTIRDGDGIRICALSRQGEWIHVPEGERYPDECLLPVAIWVENGDG